MGAILGVGLCVARGLPAENSTSRRAIYEYNAAHPSSRLTRVTVMTPITT
jgi:hypothetical protein